MATVPFAAGGSRAPGIRLGLAAARGDARPRHDHRVVGVAVVLFVILVQSASNYLSGVEPARIVSHLAFLCVELPLLMLALGATYRALKRHHVGARGAVGITVLVAGLLGAGFGLLMFAVSQRFPDVLLRPVPRFTVAWASLYGFTFAQFHMGLWALAFAYPFAIDEVRMKDLEAEKLKTAAELARLRAHLEPHFLLNTLNAIAGLVTEDPREARRLIACLGDLLRDALHDDDELQTLHAQVAWLQRYAAILQARHAGALTFDWDVAPEVRGVLLPRLLLQPLVENAVKHGALRSAGEGRVVVRAVWRDADTLVCTVEDNGPGAPVGQVREGAFGLRAVTRRVELKYPGAKVVLERPDHDAPGTVARVEIPRDALDLAPPVSGRQG
jgi:signal transduction histidine kinase